MANSVDRPESTLTARQATVEFLSELDMS